MKKILSINYSQSGQLDEILNNFLAPLEGVEVDRIKVKLKNDFHFPWSPTAFFDCMPETVLEEPVELQAINFKEDKYDLIVFGYQPWYLSPSIPTSSILAHPEFKKRLKDTPVVSVIGARNMWLNSQKSVVQRVQDSGGTMVGNVALIDRAPNLLSVVSIAHWMMTGKKERKWGIFPLPGVSQEDIEGSSIYGKLLNDALKNNELENYQQKVLSNEGIRINTSILFVEERAKKIFKIWANLIKKKEAKGKSRKFWLGFFRFYLNFALYGVAPIILTIYTLLIRPLTQAKIKKKKMYYSYLGIKKVK